MYILSDVSGMSGIFFLTSENRELGEGLFEPEFTKF